MKKTPFSRNHFGPGKEKVVTIFDVAYQAGVSTATVSRILRNDPVMKHSESTREKVLKVVKALGYRPNVTAQSLAQRQTNIIGLFGWFERQSPITYEMFLGIQSHLYKTNYVIQLLNFDEIEKDEKKFVDDLAHTSFVCGVIQLGQGLRKASSFEALKRSNIPVVVIENYSPLANTFNVNNKNGGELAGRHLIAQGARNIGVISYPRDRTFNRDRILGCKKILKEAGLPCRVQTIPNSPDLQFYELGYQSAKKLMTLQPRVDGIFSAAGDVAAIGAVNFLKENGFKVPGDVRVIGYDNTREFAYFKPSLTTIDQQAFEIGVQASSCLLDTLAGKRKGIEYIVVEPKIVVRRSS